jgi:hypothetical protein
MWRIRSLRGRSPTTARGERLANADRRELGNDAAGRGEHQRRGDLLTYWYTGGM